MSVSNRIVGQAFSLSGVYISWPFCSQKCTYCNFASGVFPRELETKYLDALAAEIAAHEWQWTPETVYFGGGSPNRMPPDAVERILSLIPGAPWREATMEAAPGEIAEETALRWRATGINRVSLGSQSFVKKELAHTARRHDADTVARDVAMLRRIGIDNLNLDLIAGLPHQTPATFAESLDWIVRLGVSHASVYMLEVDEDSRLGRELLSGGARYGAGATPSEAHIVEMYEMAVERLGAAGLERYEISNFAKPGFASIHNLKYWKREPYIGFGADAHSFDGHDRRRNIESAAEYVERAGTIAESTPADASEEKFFVGLRLSDGIALDASEWARFDEPIRRFLGLGLVERRGDHLRLTSQGVLYSNEVFQEFLTP